MCKINKIKYTEILIFVIILQTPLIKNEIVENCQRIVDIQIIERYSNNSVLTKDGDVYNEGQYTVYNETFYKSCICEVRTCVWKCCPRGYNYIDRNCVLSHSTLDFKFPLDLGPDEKIEILYNKVAEFSCPSEFYLLNISIELDTEIEWLRNGTVNMLYHNTTLDYCLDDDGSSVVWFWSCQSPDHEFNEANMKIEASVLLLSVPFLLITFLVYAILPELKNLQGKVFMCYLFNLMWGYIFLAIAKVYSDLQSILCIFSAYMIQFCFLVSFFWLNVMCFDIWRTFSGMRLKTRREEIKKFFLYCLYAWGCPLIIILVTVIIEYSPNIPEHFIIPNIGEESCFLKEGYATILYFYAPMSVIIICNVVLFAVTAFKIKSIKRETSFSLKRSDSHKHNQNEKQRFNLYLKLFLVMGVNWILEIVSYFLNKSCDTCQWLFKIPDYLNMLQGVLIFIIFICKRNIWILLKKRYKRFRTKGDMQYTTTFRTQVSTFSASNDTSKI